MDTKHKLIAAGTAAVLLAGLGAGAAHVLTPDIPRGLTVLGITIGGKSTSEARAALQAGLAQREEELTKPFPVRVEGQTASVNPQDVGLGVDVGATIGRAAGRNPFLVPFQDREVEPVVVVDEHRLAAALKPTADLLGTPVRLPAIVFDGLVPRAAYGVPGRGIVASEAVKSVTASWLRKPDATVAIEEIRPVSDRADVDRMLAELAVPAVAAPVTVRTGSGDLTLTPEQIAASLVINADERGKLTPHVDESLVRAAMRADLEKFEVQPRDAGVRDGALAPSAEGMLMDTARLAGDLMPVLRRAAPARTVAAVVKPVAPQVSSADLAAMGIKEQVSSFTTNFTGGLSSPRSVNIITGARKVDGALVKPGETFSLNGFTGPRGYAEGYRDAPIIMNGKLQPGVGGGMSQFTTTLFNASYYAGMVDVEHQPHSIYFSTYPSVIESTIFYPSLDLKFRNDTGHGVLIDTSYTSDSITVSFWSTRIWDKVTTEWGARRNPTEPSSMKVPAGPDCIARGGSPGFAQDAWRVFHKDGKEVKREKFSWRYDAEPQVTCVDP